MSTENNEAASASVSTIDSMTQMMQQMMTAMAQQQQMQTELLQAIATNTAPAGPSPPLNQELPGHVPRLTKVPEPNRPPVLEANIQLEQFDTWRAAWNDYATCYQFDSLPHDQQLARLRTFFSVDMRSELVHGIGIEDACSSLKPEEVLDRIRDYLRARKNVAVDRVAFEERRQKEGESFDDYYIDLRKIAKNADLCTECYDTRLATRIMIGIDDTETKRRLLAMKPFPQLQTVVDFCRSEESGRRNEVVLRGPSSGPIHIDKVGAKPRPEQKPPVPCGKPPHLRLDHAGGTGNPMGDAKCGYCGFQAHPRTRCPASQETCHNCGLTGHFARLCRKPKQPPRPDERKITAINVQNALSTAQSSKAPYVSVSVYSKANKLAGFCRATPDSAAEATVAGKATMERLGLSPENLCPVPQKSLIAANGGQIKCFGTAVLTFKYGERLASDTVYFCDSPSDILLSWYLSKKLSILPACYPKPCCAVETAAPCTDPEAVLRSLGPISDPPTDNQIESLKQKLMSTFSDVFDDSEELKPIKAPPCVSN